MSGLSNERPFVYMASHQSKIGRKISKLDKPLTFDEWRDEKTIKFYREKSRANEIEVKDVNPKGKHYFIREDWEFVEQSDMKGKKAFVIERWKQVRTKSPLAYPQTGKIGKIEYRISYYIVTTKNRWWFGQYATLIPKEDMKKIQNAINSMEKRHNQES